MIHLITEHCVIDGKTTDRSWSYKVIHRLLGEKIAKRLTYEMITPPETDDEPKPNS